MDIPINWVTYGANRHLGPKESRFCLSRSVFGKLLIQTAVDLAHLLPLGVGGEHYPGTFSSVPASNNAAWFNT